MARKARNLGACKAVHTRSPPLTWSACSRGGHRVVDPWLNTGRLRICLWRARRAAAEGRVGTGLMLSSRNLSDLFPPKRCLVADLYRRPPPLEGAAPESVGADAESSATSEIVRYFVAVPPPNSSRSSDSSVRSCRTSSRSGCKMLCSALSELMPSMICW